VELAAIREFRARGFSIPAVREIVAYCRLELGSERPLVSVAFKTGGREVFIQAGEALLDVSRRRGQAAWNEILEPYLQSLDYRGDWAARWWPTGRASGVILDPTVGFGMPVMEGSGVRTEIVFERFAAGDLPGQIADDFGLDEDSVARALQFEVQRLAA
jgi:uncharacterized protein (DUF433 family)